MRKETNVESTLKKCRALINQINAGLSAEEPFVDVSPATELLSYLERPLRSQQPCCRRSWRKTSETALVTTVTRLPPGPVHCRAAPISSSGTVSDLEALAESSLSGNARVGNTSVSGRGAGRYIRFDPWSWLSPQRAQA
jgi:hypothetical protein